MPLDAVEIVELSDRKLIQLVCHGLRNSVWDSLNDAQIKAVTRLEFNDYRSTGPQGDTLLEKTAFDLVEPGIIANAIYHALLLKGGHKGYRRTIAYTIMNTIRQYNVEATWVKIFNDLLSPLNVVIPTPLSPLIKITCKTMYDEDDFSSVYALSDMLTDIDADVKLINHLRNGQKHYRGCWAVGRLIGNK